MRFSINTLGCKVNLCESDAISRLLVKEGLQQVDQRSGRAHICIINTCTVTAESDRKVRQLIRKIKKKNPGARLIVMGCFVRDHIHFLKKSGADLILENEEKQDIARMASKILENSKNMGKKDIVELSAGQPIHKLHSRPIIKIQDGCEQNCAYCIIPRMRGGYRSTPEDDVIEEIDMFSEAGYAEAVLTGIHIGKYGTDMQEGNSLAGLLEKIFSRTKIGRIRISSLEINEVSQDLIEVMEKYRERTAPHLHIPLQSGSDAVLESMGRPYNARYFMDSVKNIQSRLPGFTITSDVMAGFPGETEDDLEKTLQLVEEAGFSKLHVFRYSPRPGTRAWYMEESITSQEKSRRSSILRKLGHSLRDDFINANTGHILDVAAETRKDADGLVSGTSGNYIKVYFKPLKGMGYISGRIIKVTALKRYKQGLLGEEVIPGKSGDQV